MLYCCIGAAISNNVLFCIRDAAIDDTMCCFWCTGSTIGETLCCFVYSYMRYYMLFWRISISIRETILMRLCWCFFCCIDSTVCDTVFRFGVQMQPLTILRVVLVSIRKMIMYSLNTKVVLGIRTL